MSIIFDDNSGDDYPLIFWHSVLDVNDISSATGTPAAMWSPDTYTYWESGPESGGSEIEFVIELENPSAQAVDYLAIVGHNFYVNDSGAPFSIRLYDSADGVTFSPTCDSVTPTNSGPLVVCFASKTRAFFRLIITASTVSEVTAIIAHLRLGRRLKLQRKIYVGAAPFTLNKKVDKTVNVSESGKYLGAHIKGVVNLYSISQMDNTASFVHAEINDFLNHVDLLTPDYNFGPAGTFFCAWRPDEYPDGVLYCHPGVIERPKNQRSNGMMQWGISGEAEA